LDVSYPLLSVAIGQLEPPNLHTREEWRTEDQTGRSALIKKIKRRSSGLFLSSSLLL
jgi:hypothetical protein